MNEQQLSNLKNHIRENKRYLAVICCLVFLCGALALRTFHSVDPVLEKQGETAKKNEYRVLKISPEIIRESQMTASPLHEIEPSEEILLPGRVQKDPTQTSIVTARAQGRIDEIQVKETEEVKAGQVLAVLQSTEVAQAQSEHLKTFLRFQLARRQFERSKELFEHQILSAKEFELVELEFRSERTQLESSRTGLSHLNLTREEITQLERKHTTSGKLQIRSPISGTIIERKAALGQSVTAEDTLFTVGKMDQVLITLDVYEKDIPFLEKGMEAEVRVPSPSGNPKVIAAKVARISQVIDSVTHSAKVWLEVKNDAQELKFGQAISARLVGTQPHKDTPKIKVVPIEAVHKIEGEFFVFVKLGETQFEPRKITLGWTSDVWMEIKAGVKPDEPVVSKGSFVLKSEFLKN